MKQAFRLVLIGVVALLATACATASQVTPTSAPEEGSTLPADNGVMASAAKPRFLDSFASW